MTALGMLLAGLGIVLIYSGVKGFDPRQVVTGAFGGDKPVKASDGPAQATVPPTRDPGDSAGAAGPSPKHPAPPVEQTPAVVPPGRMPPD